MAGGGGRVKRIQDDDDEYKPVWPQGGGGGGASPWTHRGAIMATSTRLGEIGESRITGS
jgi:hypothetical protein